MLRHLYLKSLLGLFMFVRLCRCIRGHLKGGLKHIPTGPRANIESMEGDGYFVVMNYLKARAKIQWGDLLRYWQELKLGNQLLLCKNRGFQTVKRYATGRALKKGWGRRDTTWDKDTVWDEMQLMSFKTLVWVPLSAPPTESNSSWHLLETRV